MRRISPCLILSLLSVLAYSQQTQPPVGSQEKPTANPAQVSAGSQPYLHEQTGGVSPTARALTSRPVGDIQEQIENLKTSLSGRQGVIEIPAGAPAGWSDRLGSSNVRYLDDRGNSLPNSTGHIVTSAPQDGFKTGFNNGLLYRATETDPASPNHYTGFMNMHFHYTAAKGGINNFSTQGGTKTDYFNVLATSEMRTIGQKTGIASMLSSFSGGDTLGIQSYITQYGGFDTGGDEQTEGIRVQVHQGSTNKTDSGGIFEGVVSDVRGNILTYAPNHDESTIGEHRLIRDLSRVGETGTVASITNSGIGSPNTVTVVGSGTHWSQLGRDAHTKWDNLAGGGGVTETDLAFCFDPLKNDGYDMCFPVSAIQDDEHLTLNLLGTGTSMNTSWPPTWAKSGGYHLYKAAWPTSVDPVAHTLTAPDFSGFSKGDRIDQVLAYNMEIAGEFINISRHIGLPGRGGGLNITNTGTAASPTMQFGVSLSGGFDSAIAIQYNNAKSGTPSYFARLFSDPGSKIMFDSGSVRMAAPDVALWRLRDSSGTNHTLLHFVRASGTTCVIDSSLCVSSKGAIEASQINQTETSNYAGTITISNELTASISFKQPYKTTPTCTLTPTSDPTGVGSYWVSVTPTSITANVKQRGKISFTYICVGNPG